MMQRVSETILSEREAGIRLDFWLAKRFTYHSRQRWQKLIRDGTILVNGNTTRISKKLQPQDHVEYQTSSISEPEVSSYFIKVYEDNEILVINKSGNLPCHPAGKFFRNTLWYLLKEKIKDFWIINRLDRETSGLVIWAKTIASARHLNKQFETGMIGKKYLVLVEGYFPQYLKAKGYLINNPMSNIRKQRILTSEFIEKGEFSQTNFSKIKEHNGLSLISAIPKTGKLHQIRASLYSKGYPIVGDKIYGPVKDCYLRFISNTMNQDDYFKLRVSRQMLHAYILKFTHPIEGCTITAHAPIPGDMLEILNSSSLGNFQI